MKVWRLALLICDCTIITESFSPMAEDIRCSLCGKRQSEALQLVAGPNVFISDECVGFCVRAIITSQPKWRERLDLTPIRPDEHG